MSESTTTSNTKFAFKQLPKFDPVHYRAWASDVRDAFAERDWNDYLQSPPSTDPESMPASTPTTELKPHITVQAKAFISQSIPYEHKYGLEDYTTAAEIFHALEQKYSLRSREDELRLKSLLLDMRKQSSDSIDQHINKFTSLMASIIAQQSTTERYDKAKRNKYFLRTLELSDIANENWIGFITYLGKGWSTLTPESLFSETRSWYESHILPFKSRDAESPDTRALTTSTKDTSSKQFTNYKKPKQDKSHQNSDNLPRDPKAWCGYHRRKGHSTEARHGILH